MLIVFFTNCQGKFIYDNYLKNIKKLNNYQVIFIRNYINDINDINDININININKKYIQDCDIFIYQPVNNYTVNFDQKVDQNLLILLKTSCIKICFPSIYIDIWPLYKERDLYYGGHIIDEYKKIGYSIDKILNMYDTEDLCFDLKNRFNKSLQYLKNKEDNYCNIKVSDFISTNYKKYRLFDTQNHPNGIIGSYIAKEICNILNIEFPIIDFFSQQNINILQLKNIDSPYMEKELNLSFIQIDTTSANYYKNLIIQLYNNPTLIKYK